MGQYQHNACIDNSRAESFAYSWLGYHHLRPANHQISVTVFGVVPVDNVMILHINFSLKKDKIQSSDSFAYRLIFM